MEGDRPEADGAQLMSIGQLASKTGVSSRTIRYYEELGILPKPPRSPGGTRRYPRDYRFYLEGALALKELGFSLEEIKLLGRLALGARLTKKQREEAVLIVRENTERLEHKISILHRLKEVLQERGARALTNGSQDELQNFTRLLQLTESNERVSD